MLNIARFTEDFCVIAQCGILNNGGVTRLAFSKEDQEARNYLIAAMRQAQLQVSIDPVGNIRGLRPGTNKNLAPVIIGSHLDSVPHGGHYDGVVGVLGALEIVRAFNDNGVETLRSIEVINFAAEESSRFAMATIGSKAITGKLNITDLENLKDKAGNSLYQILKKSGYNVDDLAPAVLAKDAVHAYLELHIEQGPILENEQCDVGIVTAIAAPSRFHVHIGGRSDHSGNTPMSMRRDALAGAAQMVLAVEALAQDLGGDMVATVGELTVHHGAMNVIPGDVEFSIDLRDTNWEHKTAAVTQLKQTMQTIANNRMLQLNMETICDDSPVMLDANIANLISDEARQLQLNAKFMPSGAGHDAMHFAAIAPTGLIFIPSIGGISHNIEEKTSIESIHNGIKLLLATSLQLANQL
jgi:N-carbamoyl-L-amino-acid hydrolase